MRFLCKISSLDLSPEMKGAEVERSMFDWALKFKAAEINRVSNSDLVNLQTDMRIVLSCHEIFMNLNVAFSLANETHSCWQYSNSDKVFTSKPQVSLMADLIARARCILCNVVEKGMY